MDIRSPRLQAALPPAAAAAFNVYLIDMHPLVYGFAIQGRLAWVNELGGALGLCVVAGVSLAMFALFLALGMVYELGRKRVRAGMGRLRGVACRH